MSGQDEFDDGRIDHRFVETMRMRVREKNPQIERKATLRTDSSTAAFSNPHDLEQADPPSVGPVEAPLVVPTLDPSESSISIYDRIEQTGEPAELDEARAQLEAALWAYEHPRHKTERAPPPTFDGDPTTPAQRDRQTTDPAPRAPSAIQSGPTQPAPIARERPPATEQPTAMDRRQTRLARPAPTVTSQPDAAFALHPTDPPAWADAVPARTPPAEVDRDRRPTELAEPFFDEEDTQLANRPVEVKPTIEAVILPAPPAQPQAPVPRGRIFAGGTKAAGVEVQRQKILREAEIPHLRSSALKTYVGFVSNDRLQRLDSVLAGDFDDREVTSAVSSKRALEHLLHERGFAHLDLQNRAELLAAVASVDEDPTTVKAALALVKTGLLSSLRPESKASLLAVFRQLDAEGRARLAQTAARRLRGHSVLEDVDGDGVGLLRHLQALVDQVDVDAWWLDHGLRIDAVCRLLVSTVAQPFRLSPEDGNEGVTGLLEFVLADVCPAELARLWRAVLGRHDTLTLRGTATVSVPWLRDEARAPTPLRGLLAALPGHVRADGRRRSYLAPGGRGLDAHTLSLVLEQLFGRGYTAAAGTPAVVRQLERVSGAADRVPPVLLTVLYEHGERLFVFDHLDQGHVYVRSPSGRSRKQAGEARAAPRREVVHPELAVDRIALSAFQEAAGVVVVPRV